MIIERSATVPSYSDYRRYKRLLRVDFGHTCAFCLTPEVMHGGHWDFAVEHMRPKKRFPEQRCHYPNLYYACKQCNTYKGETWPNEVLTPLGFRFLDACSEEILEHLRFDGDGRVHHRTPAGRYTIIHLRLNRPQLVNLRRRETDRFNRVLVVLEVLVARRMQLEPGRDGVVSDEGLVEWNRLGAAIDSAYQELRTMIFPSPID